MVVYLVRHGIAEDSSPQGDAERRLTQQGTLRTAMVAKGLKRLGLELDRIISSPYVRARQTAEIIARVIEYGEEILFDSRLTPFGRFEGLGDLLNENSDVESLMIVGHEPSMGEFIGGLCARGMLEMEVKKASVTAVQVNRFRPEVGGALLWSLPPRVIEGLS